MKLTNLLLLLFPCGLFAQNWAPLVPGETYHYRLADSTYITHSIRVDSSKAVGADVVFYLNRVLNWEGPVGNQIAFYKQGQFLGKTMTQKPDGSLVFEAENVFFDTSMVVFPNAGLGTTWLAVAENNLTASVISIQEGTVLGVQDSLKTIQFSNGAHWVLSKDHGLVSAPDFNSENLVATLSGLENQGLGDRLYRFEDFFDFNVGDVFQYVSYSDGLTGSTVMLTKMTILEKQITSMDTFQYKADIKRKIEKTGLFNEIAYSQELATIRFLRKDFKQVASYHSQAFSLAETPYFWDQFSFVSHVFGGIQLGKQSSIFAPEEKCAVLQVPTDPNQWIYTLDDALECPLGGYQYFEDFRPKLGRVAFHVTVIDLNLQERLTGAVIQGDTLWGSITPDWQFTATTEPTTYSRLLVSPNPSSGLVNVQIPEAVENGIIQVFNATGKLVQTLDFQGLESKVLDLSECPIGVYWIILRSAHDTWHTRLIKTGG